MNPTREVYWNISHAWALYLIFVPALCAFAYGIHGHYRLWRAGQPAGAVGSHGARLRRLLLTGFAHARLAAEPYAGFFHALFFAGFLVLFLGTLVVWIHEDFGLHIMQGEFYLYFQSLALDIFGLLAVIGLGLAVLRRVLFKPKRLSSSWQDAVIPTLLLTVLATGFAIEGIRLVATGDPWAAWSPVGLAVGRALSAVAPEWTLRPMHASLWWFHLALVCGLMAWAPHSKLLHVFTAAANIYLRPLHAKGALLKPLALDGGEAFGVNRLDQFTWKDLLDLDACTECGRCQDACPAYATGKPLSPKSLILDLRGAMRGEEHGALIGAAIKEETLWACTNCMACMEACPVSIAHVPKIVDMRRHLVMEEGRAPEPMQQAMRNLETRGHPFAGAAASRLDWCKDISVKVLSGGERAEYLYWVGCATALNPRNQKTARAFSQLMTEAGIDFAILGNDEACNGDAARRMGNEYLFQAMVQRNLDVLRQHDVKKIVTTCPHCFNTFRNEYPQFGGNFDVYHHSELLARLLKEGRLKPAAAGAGPMTFHDPCHLGRYNEVYEEPREVIEAVPGATLTEMSQSRRSSFCCGGGGGRTWAEEPAGQRVGDARARQALDTQAETLAVACPFCMLMLEEGVKAEAGGRNMKVLDIAEVLQGAFGGPAQAN